METLRNKLSINPATTIGPVVEGLTPIYLVRWLIGNAPRQNVGGIAGSSPVQTTNVVQLHSLIEVVVSRLWRYELHQVIG